MKSKAMASFILTICLNTAICLYVAALDDGQYVVSNTTYYVNPNTGETEDGGDTSIGEAMARNAVADITLYEKTPSGQFVVKTPSPCQALWRMMSSVLRNSLPKFRKKQKFQHLISFQ